MKLMLGSTPIKKTMIHNDTQDATMVPSDLQAGVTCYAKGQKVIGTGKSFEFATYGDFQTNMVDYVPGLINTIEIASLDYPIKSSIAFSEMKNVDFSAEQTIGFAIIDNIEYPIIVNIDGSFITLNCEKTILLQVFLGKDNYV